MAGARNRPLRWPHGHFRDPLPRPHCLELIRWVESGGEVVEITRHGKTVARLIPPRRRHLLSPEALGGAAGFGSSGDGAGRFHPRCTGLYGFAVKVLLETHLELVAAGGVHLSAMSLWEAQMLHSKGRLSLDRPLAAWLHQAAAPGVVALLPLSIHGDPADRLIVATALTHGLPLATQDSAIQASGVIPIWEGSA